MALTEEKIADLESKGFRRWTKGSMDRLYIHPAQLGLVCTFYKTGNIRTAEFDGVGISNSQARRIRASRTFIDVNTERVHSDMKELAEKARLMAEL